jgi:hypothetical protein
MVATVSGDALVSSHTPLHTAQADEFAQVISEIPFADPERPIVSNISAELLRTAAEVRAEFEAQLKSPVLWAENVRRMTREGVDTFIEVGPGHSLSRMVKRIAGEVTAVSLDDARDKPIPISVSPFGTRPSPPGTRRSKPCQSRRHRHRTDHAVRNDTASVGRAGRRALRHQPDHALRTAAYECRSGRGARLRPTDFVDANLRRATVLGLCARRGRNGDRGRDWT